MKVIVNIGHNIETAEESIETLEALVTAKLEHVSSRLTRVEVHLSNESAGRDTGDEIRCLLDARPEGREPETVTENAATVDLAVSGALAKLVRVLNTTFGKLDHRKGHTSMGGADHA